MSSASAVLYKAVPSVAELLIDHGAKVEIWSMEKVTEEQYRRGSVGESCSVLELPTYQPRRRLFDGTALISPRPMVSIL